jgi:hypothetical protein
MITAKGFDLGSSGITTKFNCSECFAHFEVNFLMRIGKEQRGVRIQAGPNALSYCQFCGIKVYDN